MLEALPAVGPEELPDEACKDEAAETSGASEWENRGAESGEYEQGPTAYTPHCLCVPDGVGSVLNRVREGALSEDSNRECVEVGG